MFDVDVKWGMFCPQHAARTILSFPHCQISGFLDLKTVSYKNACLARWCEQGTTYLQKQTEENLAVQPHIFPEQTRKLARKRRDRWWVSPRTTRANCASNICAGALLQLTLANRMQLSQGRRSRSGRGGHGRPTFWAIFFFNQLVNKLLCWVKQ